MRMGERKRGENGGMQEKRREGYEVKKAIKR